MAGDANHGVRPQYLTRLVCVHVLLPQMNPGGSCLSGRADIIVDQQRDAMPDRQ
ncbi:hypothetical protein AAIA72_13925 [Hahella sp. SMD15-11]|uniref:Uncharacterized protein n=1 Tax=Thermohahella caldifontis TaxID=3142973 RepID=A0AB39UU56_9GAMM